MTHRMLGSTDVQIDGHPILFGLSTERSSIILRINRRRLLLASPWIVAVIYTYARLHISPQESVGLALVGVAILWSIVPVGMITQFSSTTDESGTAFWFKALVVVALLLLAASGLSAIFTLLLGKVTTAAVLTLIFAAVTHGMYAVYFHRYRMMHFDIMAPRQG
ncbi:MAG: hypothetical protein EOP84_37265 [Verrucomicrobiaceae bacterium]|nr:MAG: hypothetical protein EOP84_37265 [Verrucomicrobiaceae bacterium]